MLIYIRFGSHLQIMSDSLSGTTRMLTISLIDILHKQSELAFCHVSCIIRIMFTG